jgi:hypothetical protein
VVLELATDANISIAQQQQSHHHMSPSPNHCIKHILWRRVPTERALIQTHSCIIAAVQTPFIIAFHTIQVASRRNNTCPPSATINIRYRISTWPSVQSDDAAELNDHLSLLAFAASILGLVAPAAKGARVFFLPHTSGRKRRRSKFNVTRRDGYALITMGFDRRVTLVAVNYDLIRREECMV